MSSVPPEFYRYVPQTCSLLPQTALRHIRTGGSLSAGHIRRSTPSKHANPHAPFFKQVSIRALTSCCAHLALGAAAIIRSVASPGVKRGRQRERQRDRERVRQSQRQRKSERAIECVCEIRRVASPGLEREGGGERERERERTRARARPHTLSRR